MSACPSCGTPPASPGQHFCAKCGTNLAPVEPPAAYGQPSRITGPLFADDLPPPPPVLPPPPPPPPPTAAVPPAPGPAPIRYDDRPARRRTSIVLLAAAALVAALVGAGAVVLVLGDDDEGGSTAEDRRTSDAPTTDAATSAPSTPVTSASEMTEPAGFTCWNGGRPVERLASCSLPAGTMGLVWVFPTATGDTCRTEAGVQRAAETDCYPIVSGDSLRVHYSQWRSRTALETYYGGNTIGAIGAPGGRSDLTALRVKSRDSSVGYKVALYYRDPSALWSVTIYAADQAQYLEAADQLDIRPFQDLRGTRE